MPHLFDVVGDFYLAVMPQPADRLLDLNATVDRVLAARAPHRKNEWFWPSSLNSTYSCDRREVLSRIEGIYTDRVAAEPDRIRTMDAGRALHAFVQDQHLAPSGLLYGDWRCAACQQTGWRNQTRPTAWCGNRTTVVVPHGGEFGDDRTVETVCAERQAALAARGETAWLYEELRLRDADHHISGRVDGVILLPDGRWFTLEMKSIEPEQWEGLQRTTLTARKYPALAGTPLEGTLALAPGYLTLPAPNHVNQGAIYSELLLRKAEAGELPGLLPARYSGTLVSYINRATLKLRTFLRRNSSLLFDEAARTVVRTLATVAQADLNVRKDPKEERERVAANRTLALKVEAGCRSRDDKKAKECPWQTLCFPYKNAAKNQVVYLT